MSKNRGAEHQQGEPDATRASKRRATLSRRLGPVDKVVVDHTAKHRHALQANFIKYNKKVMKMTPSSRISSGRTALARPLQIRRETRLTSETAHAGSTD